MARIEFQNVEQKMEDLRGYYKGSMDPDKNPYRASELTDDEFNFISGMNYVLSYITDNYLDNYMGAYGLTETTRKMAEEFARQLIEDFAQWGFAELGEIMTSFIDNHEDEE